MTAEHSLVHGGIKDPTAMLLCNLLTHFFRSPPTERGGPIVKTESKSERIANKKLYGFQYFYTIHDAC